MVVDRLPSGLRALGIPSERLLLVTLPIEPVALAAELEVAMSGDEP